MNSEYEKQNISDILALTSMQEGMLFHYLKESRCEFYSEQLCLEVYGNIDPLKFETAWNTVVNANEMLRTFYRWEKINQPAQAILKEHKISIDFHDLSGTGNKKDLDIQLEKIKFNDRQNAFDLRNVPFGVTLIKAGETDHFIVLSNHHILYDGWSTGIILEEFFQVYHALVKGEPVPQLPGKPQFKEFVRWLRQQDSECQKAFWQDHLAGLGARTQMPFKRKRDLHGDGPAIDKINVTLENGVKEKLDIFLKDRRITPGAFFFCAWGVLLQRYCDSHDVVFGTTVSGRSAPIKGIEKMVGLFINTIPLRLKNENGDETIGDLLEAVNHVLASREAVENTPLVEINRWAGQESGEELFDSIVVVENYPLDSRLTSGESGLSIKSFSIRESTNYDISVSIATAGAISIDIIYFTSISGRKTIQRMGVHFKRLMEGMIECPGHGVHEIDILSEEERHQLLVEFNDIGATFSNDKTIPGLFGNRVEQNPDAIALVGKRTGSDEVERLGYRDLSEASGGLARHLSQKGAQPGHLIGILAGRSIEMIIGMLAILETGAAYVPLNPQAPASRNCFMLEDCNVDILLTTTGVPTEFPGDLEIIRLAGAAKYFPATPVSTFHGAPDQLAYVIYTSGSTGQPKGVPISHGNLSPLLHWGYTHIGLDVSDRSAQNLSYYFDWSAWEIFIALTSGASLYTISRDLLLDADRYVDFINENEITTLHITPTHFQALVHCGRKFTHLKHLAIGAEKLTYDQVQRSFQLVEPGCRVYNMYGPTEATIMSAVLDIDADKMPYYKELSSVPIGETLGNTTLYVLDSHFDPCPVYVTGELYIGGDALSRGYLNNPELTAEKFVLLNSSYGSYRTYKTGDLVRWLPDGTIEFLGRADHQVKIRGFRIELGEIENRLLEHKDVKEAVVLAREQENGEKYLCAYVVTEQAQSVHGLKEFLSGMIPEYMIPSYYVPLEKMPLNPNGKIDTRALPEPEVTAVTEFAAPRNDAEKTLVSIWAGVLGVDASTIGIDSDFFQLGGHSLNVTRLVGLIHKTMNIQVPFTEIFIRPTIRELAQFLGGEEESSFGAIPPVEDGQDHYALSAAQERVFVLQQMDEASTVYNIHGFMELEGVLDDEKFRDVFNRLIQRHESFRTSFHIIDGHPVQGILDRVEFSIEDIGPIGPIGPINDIIARFIQAFDLSQAPLLRVGLAGIGNERHLLMIDMHHIISDGTSMGVLVKEFMALYNGEKLPAPQVRYRDFAAWFNRRKKEGALKPAETYWLKQFEDDAPILDLPVDFPRPAVQSFEGAHIDFSLDYESIGALRAFAHDAGTTLYSVLVSLFTILLSKLSGQEDIVVGTPVAGRRHEDLSGVVGMFVNTLALRNYPSGKKTLKDFVREVGTRAAEAFEHQEYPFEDLVEKVSVSRDAGRNPLFDAMFAMLNIGIPVIRIPGLHMKPYRYDNGIAKFDFIFICEENGRDLDFTVEYCTRLLREDSIRKFIGYFKEIVWAISRDRNRTIGSIEIITPGEKQEILERFNNFQEPFCVDNTIHGLFRQQVERTPDNIALVGMSEQQLSFKTLDEISDAVAGNLVGKGAVHGDMIGILAERSVEMIIGIIGILKTGCAYVPLNPKAPASRNRLMLNDCHVRLLLTTIDLPPELTEGLEVIGVAGAMNCAPTTGTHPLTHSSTQLCYVIYTSGSTGLPKGVAISHGNFSQLIHWGYRHLGIGPNHRSLQNLSYYFDWSVWEIFITLTTGAALYMVPGELLMNPVDSVQFMNTHGITVLHVTPTQYQYIVGVSDDPVTLRYLFIGAEKLTYDLVKRSFASVHPGCRVFNQYGPTEATIISAVLEIHRDSFENYRDLSSVPIGLPTGNTCLFVLDRYLNLCPVNIAGELYISGEGVARGYLNNPELTAEKFICLNRSYGSYRAYKTGDLARWLPSGEIEYLGRIDHQVKIRGFRIELGEIENRLLENDNVKEAVVIAREEAGKDLYLCAYVVPKEEIDGEALRQFLSLSLPDYMVPYSFTLLTQMPLNANGKVDRKALPAPDVTAGKRHEAPRSERETVLAQIWAEVLEIDLDLIGLDSSFFQLGGHSLKATLVIAKIHETFDVKLQLTEVFVNPTLRLLAAVIESAVTDRHAGIERVRELSHYPLSSAQKRLYIIQKADPGDVTYHIPLVRLLKGNPDKQRLESAFKRLIRRHESFRTAFEMVKGEPAQRIRDEVDFSIENIGPIGTIGPINNIISNFIRPFDLSRPPLIRVGLAALANDRHLLMVDMHHIISDGTSVKVFIDEFSALYSNPVAELPELQLRYRDYACWQNSDEGREAEAKCEAFWESQFREAIPSLDLMYDYPEPAQQDTRGARLDFHLTQETTGKLKQIAQDQGATLFMILMAIHVIMLHKLSWKEDIVVGTPVTGRGHTGLQPIIGMFVNTLALRYKPAPGKTFSDFLSEVKTHTLDAFENQGYPFETLMEKTRAARQGRNNLFDTMLVLQNLDFPTVSISGIELEPYDYKHPFSRFDITLIAEETGEGPDGSSVHIEIEYKTGSFSEDTIKRFAGYFSQIAEIAAKNSLIKLSDINPGSHFSDSEDTLEDEAMGDFSF